ncbi:hypothetical protein CHLRE_06g306601v5 [Chlamydomonas reinhardtii]|uniref:anthranilate synthase n=1 Tax=Chlamydomonas reinhardtii TaxID=3055 RepID=A0A2K3DRC8_CHLRE|nr:uncharacterized protein CHLRE_06g306601v5 [Chlamydomonas reinhardtii]PNW83101.1 hypothetical protein CHLRE_06g306601v5 [Chlamydomonas reinhardtii]
MTLLGQRPQLGAREATSSSQRKLVAPCAQRAARAAFGRAFVPVRATATLDSSAATRSASAGSAHHASSGAATSASGASADAGFQKFLDAVKSGANLVPLSQRIFSDHLTPVSAYRCLVPEGDSQLPSFLLESVVNGDQQGRYSFLGSSPALEVVATQDRVVLLDHDKGSRTVTSMADPMQLPEEISRNWRPAAVDGIPNVFTGGWVGYAGYDTVRYVYGSKLPFDGAPEDDRRLPDMHLALYYDVVVFDQATKIAYPIAWVPVGEQEASDPAALRSAYEAGQSRLAALTAKLAAGPVAGAGGLLPGAISLDLNRRPEAPGNSNMTKQEFMDAVGATKEHIQAGDIFQLVLSQRFERRTFATPFEIYRALRVVNPSPYMVYMQARGCHIVSSSPEILCRVDNSRVVTNRPLAGTRARGKDPQADKALEADLLADQKEIAEHVMLVDLGRNDVGKVAVSGSVVVQKLMEVERYSHVMHISSTVTGELLPQLDSWDALRAALPAGTVSGAPKVRAMQIIDELEVNKRGPYGGGVGHVSFTGAMDMALGLRTMIIPDAAADTLYKYTSTPAAPGAPPRREWSVHIQAGAGIVADSKPEAEYEETVNKAAALGRAVDLAEQAFVADGRTSA